MKRLSIDVSNELYERFASAIPWGLRARVVRALLIDVIAAIESRGLQALDELLSKSNEDV